MKFFKALLTIMVFLQVFAFANESQYDINTLTVGESINSNVSTGDYKHYIVSGASTIKLYNLSSDIDMYVVSESGQTNDCNYEVGIKDEICEINPSDIHYVLIHGYQGGSFSLIATNKTDTKTIILNEDDSVTRRNWKYYEISDASNVKLFNLSSDLDLYVKAGSKPTLTSYDCRSYKENNAEETCEIDTLGKVYIGVYGYTSGSFSLVVTGKKIPPTDEMSEKKHIVIFKNIEPGICESNKLKDSIIKIGVINPIFQEETNNVTCATYGKKNDGYECKIFYKNNGNVSCIIGYDEYIETSKSSRNISNGSEKLDSIETIINHLNLQ